MGPGATTAFSSVRPVTGSANSAGQLLVGPKRGELNTGGMEFLKRRLIPHEFELADAIVGER